MNNCFYNYNNTGKIWSDYTYFSIIADHKTNRDITNNDSEYTPYLWNLKPWEHSFAGKKTCTGYIWDIKQELLHNKEKPIDRHQIASTLSNQNILRQTKTIQISTNLKFPSIGFDTTTTMKNFCLEPLTITDTYQISFRPDFIKRYWPKKWYTTISFFNIPAEADIQLLNDFLDQFANVEGEARYQTKKYNDIEYRTGTITYKVSNIVTGIPRYNTLFGRSIKCIYDNQPLQNQRRTRQRSLAKETEKNQEHEIDTQTLDQQQQQPNSQSTAEAEPNNREEQKTTDTEKNIQNDKQQQTTNKLPNTKHNQTKSTNKTTQNPKENTDTLPKPNNITTRKKQNRINNQEYKMDTNPPDFNDENYPIIQKQTKPTKTTQQPIVNSYNITMIPETPIEKLQQSEDSISFLSPSVVTKTTMASTTPQPLDTSTPTKDSDIETRLELHQIKLQPKDQYLTQAKKVVGNLKKMNFLDTGTLTNAYEFEKHSIMDLVMYYKLGRHDHSDKFVQTYKNKRALEIYKMTSEERLHMKHGLYKIYAYLHSIKDRSKPINKSKLNKTVH